MRKKNLRKVLIADDDEAITNLLSRHVPKIGLTPVTACDGKETMEMIKNHGEEFCIALLDLQMPHVSGIDCLKVIRESHPDISVVILSAKGELEDAVTAMKEGAVDYMRKPFCLDELLATLTHALSTNELKSENRLLREAVGFPRSRTRFIGNSQVTRQLMEDVERVSKIDTTVLITGESGVGKSLLAKLVHESSARHEGSFVAVSCPAMPRELLESELFGHEKGSFTGAYQQRLGKFEIADKGTLFLDEIGEMPIDLQPKLLTALQEHEFQRVGGAETLKADIRVIAATKADLTSLMEKKAFREDLYYRLNVITLHLPPLRERREDLQELAEHFLKRIASDRGMEVTAISPDAMEVLLGYDWPGNVRQFENALERASAFCEDGIIQISDLPSELNSFDFDKPSTAIASGNATLQDIEQAAIEVTLLSCGNNKAAAARRLGISEKSIYNKMKRHGLR